MITNFNLSVLILVANLVVISYANDNHFKVPLEVRQQNRPERFVDRTDDPDLKKLKEIQDDFFHIVGNSSLGKEFKSFNQLLHLLDSESGIQLGRLMLHGVMIAYGKDNSNVLLTEFLDDFQYRVSPDFADALVDYKDFLRTVDLSLIPLTIETLFRKDELGNSLAQLPLGQLIDLVQPEASKYGIDIKSVINGILGKGDSTFPDIVRKLLDNFNLGALLGGIPKSAPSEENEVSDKTKKTVTEKRAKLDPTLMLFRPFISKMLKENNIDLEADAVIQVLSPFITPLLQSFMPSSKDGKDKQKGDLGLSQLLPMLALFSSQLGKPSSDSKSQQSNILETVMSLMSSFGKDGGEGSGMANLIRMASAMFQMPNAKKSKDQDSESAERVPGPDMLGALMGMMGGGGGDAGMESIMQMAAAVLQGPRIPRAAPKDQEGEEIETPLLDARIKQLDLDSDIEKIKSGEIDPSTLLKMTSALIGKSDSEHTEKTLEIIEMASKMFEDIGKVKMDDLGIPIPDAKFDRSKSFPAALLPFLLKLQTDEKFHTKVKDAFALGKMIVLKKFKTLDEFKEFLTEEVKKYSKLTDVSAILKPFYLEGVDFSDYMEQATTEEFRETLGQVISRPAAIIAKLIASDDYQNKLNVYIIHKVSQALNSYGLRGITLENFPARLRPLLSLVSKGWDLPVNIESLLDPLQYSLRETVAWYFQSMRKMNAYSEIELGEVFAESLYGDVAYPVISIWQISKASKSSPDCIPRAVCDLVNNIEEGHHFQELISRLGSIIYSGFRGDKEENYMLITQTLRAALFKGNCKEYFPIECPREKLIVEEELVEKDTDKHEEL